MRHKHRFGDTESGLPLPLGAACRMVEPSMLYLLAQGRATHGYDLTQEVNELGLTGSAVASPAVYRCLREAEGNGYVTSTWEPGESGPARRVYEITESGWKRLEEWAEIIDGRAEVMKRFTRRCRDLTSKLSKNHREEVKR